MSLNFRLIGFACLAMVFISTELPAADPQLDTSVTLSQLDLIDYRGRTWALDDFSDRSVLIVAFLGTECPMAQHYALRLQAMADQYRERGVGVIAVMSNRQDSLEEIAAFAARQKIEFPVMKDAGNRLADQVGATRTPEMFVFDDQRALRYQGRVDDQYGIGYIRDEPRHHELRSAVEQLLDHKPVSIPRTEAVGCIIGRTKKVDLQSEVTYGSHVAEILHRRCVECHREGEIAPFSLTDYDEVAGWSDMIAEVVRDGRMPPWHATDEYAEFANDRRLSEEEREAIFAWADAGAPAGDLSDLPSLPERVSGWQLPSEPDVVLPLTKEPYKVPATGTIRYKYFAVDPGFESDTWIKAAQIKPGNPAVVHHVLGFAVPKGNKQALFQSVLGFKFEYVPGVRVFTMPEGHAMRIPAGHWLLFQVHYTSIGTPQTDQSHIGIVLADPDDVTHEVMVSSAFELNIRIPPGAENHVIHGASPDFPPEATVLALNPHMHVRGKAFRYELEMPNGTRTTLMDSPNYDFNWQTNYTFATPLSVPEGSRILGTATYDNSENNLSNPDPNRWVGFGDQTWDEMMIGYYYFSIPRDGAKSGVTYQQIFEKNELKALIMMVHRNMDQDGDGKVDMETLPLPLRFAFNEYDANRDRIVTTQEVDREVPELLMPILSKLVQLIR